MPRVRPDSLTRSLLPRAAVEELASHTRLLPGFALPVAPQLWDAVRTLVARSPWRHMVTPGGFRMSVAMSNCGQVGWVTDAQGYRYSPLDPQSGRAWPKMPAVMRELAGRAAQTAGFDGFEPDACLINRYLAGSRLTAHQDRNERDFTAPVVSVSLGLPATFFFGGLRRTDPSRRYPLCHGDVVVWGGAQRLAYHGVTKLDAGEHPLTGACRVNLTFRRAL
jgi:alkylated DNA repair protein (DNA oxidative demethylase)